MQSISGKEIINEDPDKTINESSFIDKTHKTSRTTTRKRKAITQEDINEMKMTLLKEQLHMSRIQHAKQMEIWEIELEIKKKKLSSLNNTK